MEKDVKDRVQKRQLTWFGHTRRRGEKSWTWEVPKWVPQDKHEQGRSRRGWRDDMKEGTEARDRAEDDCCRREEWGLGEEKRRQL
jgi:hypothetical protein